MIHIYIYTYLISDTNTPHFYLQMWKKGNPFRVENALRFPKHTRVKTRTHGQTRTQGKTRTEGKTRTQGQKRTQGKKRTQAVESKWGENVFLSFFGANWIPPREWAKSGEILKNHRFLLF